MVTCTLVGYVSLVFCYTSRAQRLRSTLVHIIRAFPLERNETPRQPLQFTNVECAATIFIRHICPMVVGEWRRRAIQRGGAEGGSGATVMWHPAVASSADRITICATSLVFYISAILPLSRAVVLNHKEEFVIRFSSDFAEVCCQFCGEESVTIFFARRKRANQIVAFLEKKMLYI